MNAPQPPAQKGPVVTYAAQAQRQRLKSELDNQILDEIYEASGSQRSTVESAMLACARDDRQELTVRRRQISSASGTRSKRTTC